MPLVNELNGSAGHASLAHVANGTDPRSNPINLDHFRFVLQVDSYVMVALVLALVLLIMLVFAVIMLIRYRASSIVNGTANGTFGKKYAGATTICDSGATGICDTAASASDTSDSAASETLTIVTLIKDFENHASSSQSASPIPRPAFDHSHTHNHTRNGNLLNLKKVDSVSVVDFESENVSRSYLPHGKADAPPTLIIDDNGCAWSSSAISSTLSTNSLENSSLFCPFHLPSIANLSHDDASFSEFSEFSQCQLRCCASIISTSSSAENGDDLELSCFSELGLVSIASSTADQALTDRHVEVDHHNHALTDRNVEFNHVCVAIPDIDECTAITDRCTANVDASNIPTVHVATSTISFSQPSHPPLSPPLHHISLYPTMINQPLALPAQARLLWTRYRNTLQDDSLDLQSDGESNQFGLESISLDG